MSRARSTEVGDDGVYPAHQLSANDLRATELRLPTGAVDISTRALVIGVIDTVDRPIEDLLGAAQAYLGAGADMLELVPCPDEAVVGTLRTFGDLPLAVRTDDVEEVRGALDAGAVIARTGAPPSHEYLDALAVRDAAIVITDPSGDAARLATACGLDAEQIVLEVQPDGFGDSALADALHSVPHAVDRGHPVAFVSDADAAAIAWAVQRGARLVYTRHVAPAARIVRTFAAVYQGDVA